MKTILIRGIALFTIAIAATALHASSAKAEETGKNGCWYTPPAPPSCAECSGTCNVGIGQQCCTIVIG